MGLSAWLAARAVQRAHVLVVEVPGWATTRFAVERALDDMGWTLALSPADADVLLVCGSPAEQLAAVADALFEQLPGPRARVEVVEPQGIPAALAQARDQLLDLDLQSADARDRGPGAGEEPSSEHGGHDMGGHDMGGHDMGGHDMGGHDMGGHDMGGHDMGMAPSGIPLAQGADDRDGLEMDVLQVALGPVLPSWPAGLVLRCTLAGDVVSDAEAELLPAERLPVGHVSDDGTLRARAARRCEVVHRVLRLAGAPVEADRARRARDALAVDDDGPGAAAQLDALGRSLRSSRALRWMLRGTAAVGEQAPAAVRGDAFDRLVRMLDAAAVDARGEPGSPSGADLAAAADGESSALAALPRLVAGMELAAVRLLVAGLEIDVVTAPSAAEAAHA